MNLRKMLAQLWEDDKQIGGRLFNDLVQTPISDAYWSLTHPIDRLRGRGRASEQTMAIPMGPIKGMPPGYQIVRASPGEMYKTWSGGHGFVPTRTFGGYNPRSYSDPPQTLSRNRAARNRGYDPEKMNDAYSGAYTSPVPVYYNALDPEGNIVGSITAELGKRELTVPEAFVEPAYRKTPVFQALGEQITKLQPHLPVHADFANPELALVASRYLRNQGRELKGVRSSDLASGAIQQRMKREGRRKEREARRAEAKEKKMQAAYDIRTEAPMPVITGAQNLMRSRTIQPDLTPLTERLARVEASAQAEARRRMIEDMIARQPSGFARSIRRQDALEAASTARWQQDVARAQEIMRRTRDKQTMRHMSDVFYAHGRQRRSGR